MSTQLNPRARLLAGLPLAERRVELAGIATPVLEGGSGPAVVLLHGPGEFAAKWMCVIPELIRTHRVIAPDLPGHGESQAAGAPLTPDRVLAWLDELIDATCPAPPTVVGHVLGGAIAARFAIRRGSRLARLVLVDSLGLAPFRPAPMFGLTLAAFVLRPGEGTYRRFLAYCLHDVAGVRERLGELWEPLVAYNLDRARTPSSRLAMRTLMREVGVPAMPPEQLSRIGVETSLIWGRHDLANRLRIAEAASARYGWPLRVIEDSADDPPIEQPHAFTAALRAALATPEVTAPARARAV
jgi:pimeloyl-ACP methyl ester carboxylesterase